LINEANTIPGFTTISMFPKLWQAQGISFSELLDRLIAYGFDYFGKRKENVDEGLGRDYGSKRIGLAVGNTLTRVATRWADQSRRRQAVLMRSPGGRGVRDRPYRGRLSLNMDGSRSRAAPRWTASSIFCANAWPARHGDR